VVLAGLSVLLTILVWTKGLEESFDRPSVTPKLSLHQSEISLLAEPALPKEIKPVFLGKDPKETLKDLLVKIPADQITERESFLLSVINIKDTNNLNMLDRTFDNDGFSQLKTRIFLAEKNKEKLSTKDLDEFRVLSKDPLLYRFVCLSFGSNDSQCIDYQVSNSMAFRLIISQSIPVLSALFGSIFLLRQIWIFFRTRNRKSASSIPDLPLSLIDMVLLVSGGFVVLGEVLFPTLIVPLSIYLTQSFASPIRESLRVFIGYSAMTLPPLFILRSQLSYLKKSERPSDGWLQWKIFPLKTAVLDSVKGWLMVLPVVLLTGWLMNILVGDQGGSNPLLELVLQSKSPIALFFLVITTVILAPLFEELIFRGALLPVLVREFGSTVGVVVSALAFALAHLSVGELAPLFVLGVGLGLLRFSSGRLFPCVLMHSLWNGITFANLVLIGG